MINIVDESDLDIKFSSYWLKKSNAKKIKNLKQDYKIKIKMFSTGQRYQI